MTQAHAVMDAHTGTAASIETARGLVDPYLASGATENKLIVKLVGSVADNAALIA